MLQPLVFFASPREVLLIGLGGGRQAKFLHRHFPSVNIVAVEIDPVVVDPARSHFQLPGDDERLRVVVQDAAACVHEDDGSCDLIVSDGFMEGDQVVAAFHTPDFYKARHRKLSPDGIMTVNVFRPSSDWASANGTAFDTARCRWRCPRRRRLRSAHRTTPCRDRSHGPAGRAGMLIQIKKARWRSR
ncbi:methyltransferase domain-containing protein [Robbsia sp. Bb-Pol-6]|uniref:Methyltransferase domain-containing protein n=1 Tax=Robbsia betulipollinis TaxID=2981849 RepID=A0ABT3ZRP5_9BURK|nr:methyltransferase domain-containing protein [Robbsia betulipollinis]MCY0389216.1 methyltransferase domain-containing protein [Robbsia betulipollinis]